jgi:hypothetical protein
MKVALVTGSRNLDDDEPVYGALRTFQPDIILHGACPTGADAFAAQWGEYSTTVIPFPADWDAHGNGAGPMRNRAMVSVAYHMSQHGHEVVVFAFPVGDSPGTRDCIRSAEGSGLKVVVWKAP